MPSVRNPHHQPPLVAWAEANKAAFDAYLESVADQPTVSFDAIRAQFPDANPPGGRGLEDGTIAQVLKQLGYEVVG